MGKKADKAGRLAAGSFWFIMAIHLIVFTAIGLFTFRGWRLFVIFVSAFGATMFLLWLASLYARRNPEVRWVRAILRHFRIFNID